MLDDIVIDTNVFVHSSNRQQPLSVASQQFLQKLLSSNANLCIDDGFDLDESKNKSAIGCEYHTHLRFVSSAFAIIAALGRKGRIARVPKLVDQGTSKRIRTLIPDKTDRIFLKVSHNSLGRTFVSHDFQHLPLETRRQIRRHVNVRTVDAREARNLV